MKQKEIEALIEPVIEDLGYELWGCEYLGQGKHSILRVYIDSPAGIGLEDCEQVSKQISALLDVEDLIMGSYTLEVSSPGIPRPLFKKEQYQRYIGQEVQVKLYKPILGKRKFTGVILGMNENILLLNENDIQHEVEFSNIVKANLKEK